MAGLGYRCEGEGSSVCYTEFTLKKKNRYKNKKLKMKDGPLSPETVLTKPNGPLDFFKRENTGSPQTFSLQIISAQTNTEQQI